MPLHVLVIDIFHFHIFIIFIFLNIFDHKNLKKGHTRWYCNTRATSGMRGSKLHTPLQNTKSILIALGHMVLVRAIKLERTVFFYLILADRPRSDKVVMNSPLLYRMLVCNILWVHSLGLIIYCLSVSTYMYMCSMHIIRNKTNFWTLVPKDSKLLHQIFIIWIFSEVPRVALYSKHWTKTQIVTYQYITILYSQCTLYKQNFNTLRFPY